ncbi:MAG: hypothetical protein D6748_06325 [Calditrichaeota bacterium]|nr:MAG: hypothetical protein D6748_06325 [Calditrichota bacterium]
MSKNSTKGLIVAIMGPDGAGKTALVEGLKHELSTVFQQVEIFHFRPRIFHSKKPGAKVIDPHGKPLRSWETSILKLFYYMLDYILGFFLCIWPLLRRSTLVVFDRYYYDLLVDPKRYRYGGPMGLVAVVAKLIPKPDLILILDVPVDRLLQRKQEVTRDTLLKLRKAYVKMATTLPNAVILNGAVPAFEVVQQARGIILDWLHKQNLSRCGKCYSTTKEKEENLRWLSQVLGTQIEPNSCRETHAVFHLPDGRAYLWPLDSEAAFVKGLNLYQPQNLIARLAWKGFHYFTVLSDVPRWILPKVCLQWNDVKEGETLTFIEHIKNIFDCDDLTLAIALGTPKSERKPILQIMSPNGKVLGYVKLGWNDVTNRLVSNEIKALQMMAEQRLPFQVPRLLYAGQWGEQFLCIQTPPSEKTKGAHWNLDKRYLSGLRSLSQINRLDNRLRESVFWQNIMERRKLIKNSYWRHAIDVGIQEVQTSLILNGQKVPFHFCHGDFAPWNVAIIDKDDTVFLFDWEYAQWEAPAGYDLYHWIVSTLWLLKKESPAKIISEVKGVIEASFVQEYFKVAGVTESDLLVLFLLYLLDRFSLYAAREPQAFDNLKLYANLIWLSVNYETS